MKHTRLAAVVMAVVAVTGALFVSASADVPGPLFGALLGHDEIPDGDVDGRGSFSAIVDGDQFCYGLTATNVDQPVGAHVHRGNAGANGPIVILLTAPLTGDPGSSSACVTADAQLLRDVLARPSQYYVNLHTTAFPGGAIRDQLTRNPR